MKSVGTDPLALTGEDMKWLVDDLASQRKAERAAQRAAHPTGLGGTLARAVPLGIGDLLHAVTQAAGANPFHSALDAGLGLAVPGRPGIQTDANNVANAIAPPPTSAPLQFVESGARGALAGAVGGAPGAVGGLTAGLSQEGAAQMGAGPTGQTVAGLVGGLAGTAGTVGASRLGARNRAASAVRTQVERGGDRVTPTLRAAQQEAVKDPTAPGREVMGRPGDELAMQVAHEGGASGRSVADAAVSRFNQTTERFLAKVQNTLGKRGDLDVTRALDEAQAAATGDTYNRLRYKPVEVTSDLADLLDDPIVQRAYEEGRSIHNSRVGAKGTPGEGKPVTPFPALKDLRGGEPSRHISAVSAGKLFRKLSDEVGTDGVDQLLFFWEDRGGGPAARLDANGNIRISDADASRSFGGQSIRGSGRVRQGGLTSEFVEWLRRSNLDMNDVEFSDAVQKARGVVGRSGREGRPTIPLGALDEMKKGLDNLVTRGERGEGGGVTARQAAAVQERLAAIRDAVDQQHPEYGQVRAVSKGFFDQKDALQFGRELLKPSTTDDLVRQRLGELDNTNPQLRIHVKMGLADAFAKGDIPADWSSNPQLRARVQSLVTPDEFATLDKQITRAIRQQERAAKVINAGEARSGAVEGSRMNRIGFEVFVGLLRSAARDFATEAQSKVRFKPPVRAEIADVLNAQGPDFIQRSEEILRRLGIQQGAIPRTMAGAASATAGRRE